MQLPCWFWVFPHICASASAISHPPSLPEPYTVWEAWGVSICSFSTLHSMFFSQVIYSCLRTRMGHWSQFANHLLPALSQEVASCRKDAKPKLQRLRTVGEGGQLSEVEVRELKLGWSHQVSPGQLTVHKYWFHAHCVYTQHTCEVPSSHSPRGSLRPSLSGPTLCHQVVQCFPLLTAPSAHAHGHYRFIGAFFIGFLGSAHLLKSSFRS